MIFLSGVVRVFHLVSKWYTLVEFVVAIRNCIEVLAGLSVNGQQCSLYTNKFINWLNPN